MPAPGPRTLPGHPTRQAIRPGTCDRAAGSPAPAAAAHAHRLPPTISGRRVRARVAAATAANRDGATPKRAGMRNAVRAARSTPSDPSVQPQQPPRVEAHQPRALGLDGGAHRLQAHEQPLPEVGDAGGIGRDERQPRAAGQRLPQPHPGVDAERLRGQRDLPHLLRPARLRRQRDRALQQFGPVTEGGGEGKAGIRTQTIIRTYVRTDGGRRGRVSSGASFTMRDPCPPRAPSPTAPRCASGRPARSRGWRPGRTVPFCSRPLRARARRARRWSSPARS